MPKVIDYTNHKIGKLTFLFKIRNSRNGNIWKYICDCGKEGEMCTAYFYRVKHQSCGCNSAFNNNYRVKNHVLLKAHGAMLKRCYDPMDKNYHNYGGRGIMVCERWHNYDNFYDDMIGTWQKGFQLDKDIIPKRLGISPLLYSPDMCCWVTHKENSRNTRRIKLDDERVKAIRISNLPNIELSKLYNVHPDYIRRIKKYDFWK